MHLIDTDIAIHLRDGTGDVFALVNALPALPCISLMTWVELEGGVGAKPALAARRRSLVAALLKILNVIPLEGAAVESYGRIVAAQGFARSRIIDRLIAATAIVNGLTLITINGADFRDIPGLALDIWPAPAAQ